MAPIPTGDRLMVSYELIHSSIRDLVASGALDDFRPTLLIAIGAGGFVPARILRSCLKARYGTTPPVQAIGLSLYEDGLTECGKGAVVRRTQWLAYAHEATGAGRGRCGPPDGSVNLQGQRVLIVDEVDDTRRTLSYALAELQRDAHHEQEAWRAAEQAGGPPGSCGATNDAMGWSPPRFGIFVVHNKLKPKQAALPEELLAQAYFRCADLPDIWCSYPWDSDDIWEHTAAAHAPGSAAVELHKAAPRMASVTVHA